MRKFIISVLVVSVFIINIPCLIQKASATEMSIKDFVNLLITIGVITPDKIPAVNAWLATLNKVATTTVSSSTNISHSGGGGGSISPNSSSGVNNSFYTSIPTQTEPLPPIQTTDQILTSSVSTNLVFNIKDLGKWVDARQQDSYYANVSNIIRDSNGGLNIFYCSSGESYNSNYAPDWRPTATNATDKINYQYSGDNGNSWSTAKAVVQAYRANGQDNLFQAACANAVVNFGGKYYLYFESYTPPSGILSIYVARSDSVSGPYEIWTNDGWKLSPTNSTWKPVLTSNMLSISGANQYATDNFKQTAQGNPYNLFYGAGMVRATEKNGQIYLYYVDTTYYSIYLDTQGNIQKTDIGNNPSKQIPYQLVSISNNPTSFPNNIGNKLETTNGQDMFSQFQVRYSPQDNIFYGFYLDNSTGHNKLVYRKSTDGTTWSSAIEIPNLPANYYSSTNPYVGILGNILGQLKLSDISLSLSKNYKLANAPVGWPDTPTYKWYYGGADIYGLKLSTSTPNTISTSTTTPLTSIATVYPACGSATNIPASSMPASNLCSVGTLGNSSGTTDDGTDRWFWGCVGKNTGWKDDTAWCFAPKIVAPPPATVVYPACSNTKNTCSIGALGENGTTGDGTNRWYWACVGQNTSWKDDTAWCFANK